MGILTGIFHIALVYLACFNFNYWAAVNYKENFRVGRYKSFSGYFLSVFECVSAIGNCFYKWISWLNRKISVRLFQNKSVQILYCKAVDLISFIIFLTVLSWVHVGITSAIDFSFYGYDQDFSGVVFGGSIIGKCLSAILKEGKLSSIFIVFVQSAIEFVHFAILYGFLNNRMICLMRKDVLRESSCVRNESMELVDIDNGLVGNISAVRGLQNRNMSEIKGMALKSFLIALKDSLYSIGYMFAGIKNAGGVVVTVITVLIMSKSGDTSALLYLAGIMQARQLLTIGINAITTVIIALVIKKISELSVRRISETTFERCCESAYNRGILAEERIEARRLSAVSEDFIITPERTQEIFEDLNSRVHRRSRTHNQRKHQGTTRSSSTVSSSRIREGMNDSLRRFRDSMNNLDSDE